MPAASLAALRALTPSGPPSTAHSNPSNRIDRRQPWVDALQLLVGGQDLGAEIAALDAAKGAAGSVK